MSGRRLLILTLALPLLPSVVLADTLQGVISSYALNAASYNFSVPSTTLSSDGAVKWISNEWAATGGKLDWGDSDVVFAPDPAVASTPERRQATNTTTSGTGTTSRSPSSTSTSRSSSRSSSASTQTSTSSPSSTNLAGLPPVLRVEYPQGSYSRRTGGAQWTSNLTTLTGGSAPAGQGGYERMLLSYDVWFPAGYNWTLGGKLPGLRGGPDRFGCSGGNQTDGTGCFSTRLMWRPNGAGEVYAYIPPSSALCSSAQTICNLDYGVSLGRDQFGFVTGQWQTVWLLVVLNEVGKANGLIQLWYNGVAALSFPQSVLRTSTSISGATGLFFSTFFGGDDTSWSSPTRQFTYYRNMQLYAGRGASYATGPTTTSRGVGRYGGDAAWTGVSVGTVLVVVVSAFLGLGFCSN